jgi:hypothetical protein
MSCCTTCLKTNQQYIIKSDIANKFIPLTKYFYDEKLKVDEIGGSCNTHVKCASWIRSFGLKT